MPRRRGVAPLEFVLVFPFLMLLMTVGWYAAKVGFTQAQTVTEARRQAWAQREQCDPGVPQNPDQRPLMSYVDQQVTRAVPGYSPIDQSTFIGKSTAGVTDKTWDDKQVPFPQLPDPPIASHAKQLLHIAQFISTITPFAPRVQGFSQMDPRANARLQLFRLEAIPYAALRPFALGTIGLGVGPMGGAIARLLQAAASNPFTAAWYLYETSVVGRGIRPALQLAGLIFE